MPSMTSLVVEPSTRRCLKIVSTALLGAFVLTACASTVQYQAESRSAERVVVDHDRVNRVDRAARSSGVEVHWVNPPKRRVRVESPDS